MAGLTNVLVQITIQTPDGKIKIMTTEGKKPTRRTRLDLRCPPPDWLVDAVVARVKDMMREGALYDLDDAVEAALEKMAQDGTLKKTGNKYNITRTKMN